MRPIVGAPARPPSRPLRFGLGPVAQWQSRGLLIPWPWVRFPPGSPIIAPDGVQVAVSGRVDQGHRVGVEDRSEQVLATDAQLVTEMIAGAPADASTTHAPPDTWPVMSQAAAHTSDESVAGTSSTGPADGQARPEYWRSPGYPTSSTGWPPAGASVTGRPPAT